MCESGSVDIAFDDPVDACRLPSHETSDVLVTEALPFQTSHSGPTKIMKAFGDTRLRSRPFKRLSQ